MWYEPLLALDVAPDALIRRAVRTRLGRHLARLEQEAAGDPRAQVRRVADDLRRQPLAVHADAANRQHYEVPAREDLAIADRWFVDGTHYARTLEVWLERFDRRRERIWPVLADTYGAGAARRWWANWRLFLIVTAEAFAFDAGRQWGVSHHQFAPLPGPFRVRSAARTRNGDLMRAGRAVPR